MIYTRQQLETALDAGRLSVRMETGNPWRARRNGKTQTWKTRPAAFRIPIKYGFKSYGNIDHNNVCYDDCWIIT